MAASCLYSVIAVPSGVSLAGALTHIAGKLWAAASAHTASVCATSDTSALRSRPTFMADSSTPACLQTALERGDNAFTGVHKLPRTDVRPLLYAQIDITKPKLRDASQGLV